MPTMRRIVLAVVWLAVAGGALLWPVEREYSTTAMGWSGGPDPNWHSDIYRRGLPFRWLEVCHHWNQRS